MKSCHEAAGTIHFSDAGVLKPHLLLAAALEPFHRPQEARAEWEAALRIDHLSPEALDGMSKSLMAQGDYNTVIELLRDMPRTENLTMDLSLAYGHAKMLDKAAKRFWPRR